MRINDEDRIPYGRTDFEDEEIERIFESIKNYYNGWASREDNRRIPKDEDFVRGLSKEPAEPTGYVAGVSSGKVNAGSINVIPADKNSSGKCVSVVVVFCLNKNKLNERLIQLVYHLGIYCRKDTQKALIITNQWDNDKWDDHSQAFEILKKELNIKIFKAELNGSSFIKSQLV